MIFVRFLLFCVYMYIVYGDEYVCVCLIKYLTFTLNIEMQH